MTGEILFFAVYENGEFYSSTDFKDVVKDKSAWFYVKRECKVSYNYGSHYDFTILDIDGQPTIISSGIVEILKFTTEGTRDKFLLNIKFKIAGNNCLYSHSLNNYEYINEISGVINFMSKLNEYGSYDVYKIYEENQLLKAKLNSLLK